MGRPGRRLVLLASFSPSTSLDLAIILFRQLLRDAPVSVGGVLVGQARDVISQRSPENHLCWRSPAVLVWCVPVLEDSLHELEVVDASSP